MPTATKEPEVRSELKVTKELIADLAKYPKKLSLYPAADRLRIQEIASGVKDFDTEIVAADPGPGEVKEEKPVETPEEPQEDGHFRKVKRSAKWWNDEINRLKQTAASEKEVLEALVAKRKEIEDAKIEAPADFIADDKTVYAEIEKLKRGQAALAEHIRERGTAQIKELDEDLTSATEKATFKSFEEMQVKFPSLKTSKPVHVLNREWGGFLDSLVTASGLKEKKKDAPLEELRQEAYTLWVENEDFQKQVKQKPPEEIDKLQVLLRANARVHSHGGTLKGNLLDIMDDDEVLPQIFQRGQAKAAQEATEKTLAAVSTTKELKTIGPSDGAAKPAAGSGVLTREEAMTTLQNLILKRKQGQPFTAEDRELNLRCQRILTGT